ncbi:MAG: outer membrane beta-barrel protein [Bacteroidota bacterium]|nr:porin family protein [Bacteroidota bacterium]
MKSKLLSVFLFLSVSVIAQSPISQGTINLNGNLSFSSQSYEEGDDNRNNLSLNPQVGYFFFDNISFGLSLSYNRISLGSVSNTNWGIGPSIRYYFEVEKVKPFVSIGYLYTETFNSSNDDKWKGNQFNFTGGIDYFITKNVALESTISYNINNDKLPESYKGLYKSLDQKSNTFQVGVGINFFIY